ncbi:MAG: hypothetical protein WCH43_05485 [Verrucomicrobiota bacterium]
MNTRPHRKQTEAPVNSLSMKPETGLKSTDKAVNNSRRAEYGVPEFLPTPVFMSGSDSGRIMAFVMPEKEKQPRESLQGENPGYQNPK